MAIDLSKVERLVDLSKKAQVQFQAQGLEDEEAEVLFVLDVSGSTDWLYRLGHMQKVTDELFVVAVSFDDDGKIPVGLLGSSTADAGEMDIDNYEKFLDACSKGGGTNYSAALRWIREQAGGTTAPAPKKKLFGRGTPAAPSAPRSKPVFAVVVTDGEPNDNWSDIEAEVRALAEDAIYVVYVGVGSDTFRGLKRIDEMSRTIKNSHYFAVPEPNSYPPEDMFAKLIQGFKPWLQTVRDQNKLVRKAPQP